MLSRKATKAFAARISFGMSRDDNGASGGLVLCSFALVQVAPAVVLLLPVATRRRAFCKPSKVSVVLRPQNGFVPSV